MKSAVKVKIQTNTEKAREALSRMKWPDKKTEIWRRTPVDLIRPEEFHFHETALENRPKPNYPPELGKFAGQIIYDGNSFHGFNLKTTQPGLPKVFTDESLIAIHPEEFPIFYPGGWQDRFAAWNESEPSHFLYLDFPSGQELAEPLHIYLNSLSRDGLTMPKLFFRFGTGWEGHLVIHFNGRKDREDRELVNAVIRSHICENAHVKMTQIQNLGRESRYIEESRHLLEADSSFDFCLLHLGGETVKANSSCILKGSGSDLHVHGFTISGKGQHKDIRIEQSHEAPHTMSRTDYDAYVEHRGRSVFQGMIRVAHEAPGTDAYLSNKNLILSDGARADAIPGLKILTDDVKCSHGSTTGKLDPAQLFYLQSRGLSLKDARRMLIEGRMDENLTGIAPQLADWVRQEGLEHLNRG